MKRLAVRRLAAPVALSLVAVSGIVLPAALAGSAQAAGAGATPVGVDFQRIDVDSVPGAAFTAVGELFPGERNIITAGYGTLTDGVPSGGGTLQVYRPGSTLREWTAVQVFDADAEIVFPNMPTLHDVDGDGLTDLVVPAGYFFDTNPTNPGGAKERSGITWWKNKGVDANGDARGFERHDIVTEQPLAYHGVAIADLDDDGIDDIVTTAEAGKVADNPDDDTVRLEFIKGLGGGQFAAPSTLADGLGGSQPVVADVNDDARLDIVSAQYFGLNYAKSANAASFLWFEQRGPVAGGLNSANFVPHTIATFGEAGFGFQIRPVPGFRKAGEVSWIGTNHQGRCFIQRVAGSMISTFVNVPEQVMEFVPGADLTQPWDVQVLSNPVTTVEDPMACDPAFDVKDSTVLIHPTDYITARSSGGQAGPGVFGYGDLDGDGDIDLAVSGDGDRRLFWIEQRPEAMPSTVLHTLTADGEVFGQSGGAVVDDLDGDGRAEMVFSSFDVGAVAIWTSQRVDEPVETSFSTSGTYTVPDGVSSLHVTATGGDGGASASGGLGGRSMRVEADLAVTPGEVLTVTVGTDGALGVAGSPGGGAAGSNATGGGGGASDIRRGGTALSDRILVAAGGGGAGDPGLDGGDAGQPGALGACSGGQAAAAGTADAGGAGYVAGGTCSGPDGADGSVGAGGDGTSSGTSGGGGGAGWYGGGGGGPFSSGAGGSSYVASAVGTNVAQTLARRSDAAHVTISHGQRDQGLAWKDVLPGSAPAGSTHTLQTNPGESANPVTYGLGSATTPDACRITGTTVSFRSGGVCEVVARQAGTTLLRPAAVRHSFVVPREQSILDVKIEPNQLVATVSRAEGVPETVVVAGSVRFTSGSQLLGTVPVEQGRAVLPHSLDPLARHTVKAEFVGTAGAADASGEAVRTPPSIVATVPRGASRFGWHRTPVRVTYACSAGSAPIVRCPAPVLVSKNGARQSIRGEVATTDGALARVTSVVSVDQIKPTVSIRGAKNRGTVKSKKRPVLRCVAQDTISGVASCTVAQKIVKKSGRKRKVSFTATAVDRAGNTTSLSGRYTWKRR